MNDTALPFAEHGLAVPETFEELMAVAKFIAEEDGDDAAHVGRLGVDPIITI